MAAPQALLCADASCRRKTAAYCSKECQIWDWKAGHKRDFGQGAAATAARRVQVQVQAAQQAQHPSRSNAQPLMTDRQRRVCSTINELAQACNWRGLAAMEPEARAVAGQHGTPMLRPYTVKSGTPSWGSMPRPSSCTSSTG
jgi:hypothetical protein